MQRVRRYDWRERLAPFPASQMVRRVPSDAAIHEDALKLMAERDALNALDNRTPAAIWLGDPPAWQSALAQARSVKSAMLVGSFVGAALRRALQPDVAQISRSAEAQQTASPGQARSTPSKRISAPRYIRQNAPNRAQSRA